MAQGGSIFFDEISELTPVYQAKLLRVVQERTYFRVGGIKECHTNARFICSTVVFYLRVDSFTCLKYLTYKG